MTSESLRTGIGGTKSRKKQCVRTLWLAAYKMKVLTYDMDFRSNHYRQFAKDNVELPKYILLKLP